MEVPLLRQKAVEQPKKEDVCFYLYATEPRCPLAWDEGMAYLQAEEKRYLRKYKAAMFAEESKGAHATAACFGDMYRRARRMGHKALLENPMTIETELAATYVRLGFDKLNAIPEDEDENAEPEGAVEDADTGKATSE